MYKTINSYLTVNKWSRPQKQITKIKALVIHWVANPNSTAMSNRNYFENRKNGKDDYGSAHEIIDLNGDVIICVPENEITYNCGSTTYTQRCINELGTSPNYCTYGIECTHVDWNGKMSDSTYNTLVERCADLCIKFKLNPLKDLWTHKEVVGWKDCHLWFVNNPIEWTQFKNKVKTIMDFKLIKEVVYMLFKDEAQISPWALPSVKRLKELGIVNGDNEGNFNSKAPITREQMAVVIDKVLHLLGK